VTLRTIAIATKGKSTNPETRAVWPVLSLYTMIHAWRVSEAVRQWMGNEVTIVFVESVTCLKLGGTGFAESWFCKLSSKITDHRPELINPTTSLSLLSFRGKVEHSNIFDI
jgi:hypothetical protein